MPNLEASTGSVGVTVRVRVGACAYIRQPQSEEWTFRSLWSLIPGGMQWVG